MRHSSFLEVNLRLLAENFSAIKSLAPKAGILPMVKADAYGNGLVPVSQFLVRDCAVQTLGCASLGEALHLMEEAPDLPVQVLVFSDTEIQNPDRRKAYLNSNIAPVLHQRGDLEAVLKDPAFKKIPLILKVNTGMNRLGLTQEDLEAFLPYLKNCGVKHLLTHFARSSQLLSTGDKTHKQFEEFLRMKEFLVSSGVSVEETSVSNSGAIEQSFGIEETFVRPGLMLYGPPSVTEPMLWRGHQVSKLITKVLSTFRVKKGDPVGYGVNVADKDSFFAVLPIGYGDGFLTYFAGTKLTIKGQTAKVFGRVNMDMMFLQFDPDAEKLIRTEERIEIWNNDNRVIADLATQNKTIPYQLMCGVSSRIPRIYKVN